jgi:hypothetical protein
VRRKLLGALVLICAVGAAGWLSPEFRATAFATVFRPVWETMISEANHDVWTALGLATVVAVPIRLLHRRLRESFSATRRFRATA